MKVLPATADEGDTDAVVTVGGDWMTKLPLLTAHPLLVFDKAITPII